ncbi:MAG: hypothetical protein IT379_03390 [Deltaproteobacteria bacterium]|nr:hypothetical protein [Deltaproteobacteria bacterium]
MVRLSPLALLVFFVACAAEPSSSGPGSSAGGPANPWSAPDASAGSTQSDASGPSPAEPPSVPVASTGETCSNGLDDDHDGRVDDGCACLPGTSQPCYRGDPARIGRGACRRGTQGCEGSGEFGTWTECVGDVLPSDELCGDGIDQDCSGAADDGSCGCTPGAERACYEGPDGTRGVGICADGSQSCVAVSGGTAWGACLDAVSPRAELCGNGLDDDCNGAIDDGPGCACPPGETRECYAGPRAEIGVGVCRAGTQRCESGGIAWSACDGEVGPSLEVCDNGLDDDCNGVSDDGCAPPEPPPTPSTIDVPIFIAGDCQTARCPAEAPYPVGCEVFFSPGDDRGCVASSPGSPVVYFQAGDQCDRGFVTGTLHCSTTPGPALDSTSCPINKPTPMHVSDRGGCPETH